MITSKKIFLLLIIIICSRFSTNAQSTDKGTRSLTKWERKFGEVKHGNNVYQKGSNWLNIGFGKSYHLETESYNQNIALAGYFRYKAVFFNAGWHFSTPEIVNWKPFKIVRSVEYLNDFHAGAGLRFEDRWYHFGFFIGPSWATTLVPNEENPKISTLNHQLGAHVELQLIYKYFYDMGVGVSLYGSFNKRYQVAGVQLTFYFSNAFITKY